MRKKFGKMSIDSVEEKLVNIHSTYRAILDHLYNQDVEPLNIEIHLVTYRKYYNKISKRNNSNLRRFKGKIGRKKG